MVIDDLRSKEQDMKIKSFLLTALLIGRLATLQAAPVDITTAERIARNFWNAHHDKDVVDIIQPMQLVTIQWDAFYLFQPNETDGFVIVAADDRVQPVLAYSFHNNHSGDSVSPSTIWWLSGWQQQIDMLRNSRLAASDEVATLWQTLYDNSSPENDPIVIVEPMLTTQWDQDTPYNDSCPSISMWGYSSHAATGCVATAMAQVMKYWEYPTQGYGSHSYYSDALDNWSEPFGYQYVNFEATTYDWAHMPNVLTRSSSQQEKAAVATLMYHCGVASDMFYGTDWSGGSGAFIHNIPCLGYGHSLRGYVEFFGYSSNTQGLERKHYSDSAWTALVIRELDARRPILYGGGDEVSGGHCFVCDGYDEQNYCHFNWGWSGDGDGFYALNHLAPGIGGIGGGTGTYDFTNQQQMLTDLKPHEGIDDFGPVIRHFPYTQNFENAPMGWDATTEGYASYSWYVYDTNGCQDNYSAILFGYNNGNTTDTLNTPYIVDSGEYHLQWEDRTLGNETVTYSVVIDTTTLYESTLSNAEWQQHEVSFTLNEGDSLRLQFVYYGSQERGTLMIDNVRIERVNNNVGIHGFTATDINIYPNPSSGRIFLDKEVLRAEIYDLQGREVLNQQSTSSLDLSQLSKGTYIVRLTTPTGVTVRKVITK